MLQFFANVRFSESQSDLVNYMRIDIEMFEELFSLVETQNLKKIITMHDIIYYYYSLFQITNEIKFHTPVRLSTVGRRAFPVSGATVWNDLPLHVASAPSLAVFTQRLQTFLFFRSYQDTII